MHSTQRLWARAANGIKHPKNTLIFIRYQYITIVSRCLSKAKLAMQSLSHHTVAAIRHPKYTWIYLRFRHYTMIPHGIYTTNLRVAISASSVQGAIVECGTWKGGMIAGMATLLGRQRDYYLFDSFEGLPPAELIDGKGAIEWQQNTESPYYFDNCTASEIDAAMAMSLAGIADASLVKGWFEDTLPRATFPNGIAILRMDADWYKSTSQILESLFPFINENGLIIIDDYFVWDGCSKAVHDYLSENNRPERIDSCLGVCFIRKKKSE